MIDWAIAKWQDCSMSHACKLFKISRKGYRYTPKRGKDTEVEDVLLRLAKTYRAWGFDLMFEWIRKEGYPWSHKRVYRVYCNLKLNLRIKPKKRPLRRNPEPLEVPDAPNKCWSIDFIHDSLMDGRSFRTLTCIDDFNREALAVESDLSLPSARVVRSSDRIAKERGYPKRLRSDNGPEFISNALRKWADDHGVHLDFIEPGKPTQNAYIERFNRTYRREVLDLHLFEDLAQVHLLNTNWKYDYNNDRPHQSLDGLTPSGYLRAYELR